MKSVHLALKIPNFANIKMTVFQRKTMIIHSLSLIFMSSARNEFSTVCLHLKIFVVLF